MLGTTFSSAFAILGERWQQVLGSVVVSAIITGVLAFVLLVPAVQALVPDVETGATSAPAGLVEVEPVTTAAPKASGPGMGDIVKVLVAIVLVAIGYLSMMTTGVFAAAGYGVADSIRLGATTSPQAMVQTLILGWIPIALYVVALLAGALASPAIGVLLGLVSIASFLRVSGTVTLAIGAIAHGHVGWQPDAARAAADGRLWTATGVSLVGGIAGGAMGVVPLVGVLLAPMFMSAFIAAMWQEFEDGTGPGANVASTANDHATTPAAAEAVTPAARPLVAGPTWNGMASAAEPLGQWLQLAAPAQVALQVQWTTGAAPVLQLSDQAGTWSTPPSQPSTSGETTWLQLSAGWTWLALVPRDSQQLWITTWLPSDAVPSSATGAA